MISIFANTAIQASNGRRGPYRFEQSSGSFIRQRRVALGLTQPEAAKFARVSLRTFQRAEARDVVPVDVRRSIERALGAKW